MSRKGRWFRNPGLSRGANILLLAILLLPPLLALLELTDFLQRQQCPVDTFQAGPLRNGILIPLYGVMVMALALAFALRHILLHRVPSLQSWLDENYRCTQRTHQILFGFTVAALLAGGGMLWMALLSQYCLSDSAILHRDDPRRAFVSHQWKDVEGIVTGCRRGARGHSEVFYLLTMRDGTAVDIGDSLRKLEASRSRLAQKLRGQSLLFDDTRVAADCPAPLADLLRTPP